MKHGQSLLQILNSSGYDITGNTAILLVLFITDTQAYSFTEAVAQNVIIRNYFELFLFLIQLILFKMGKKEFNNEITEKYSSFAFYLGIQVLSFA